VNKKMKILGGFVLFFLLLTVLGFKYLENQKNDMYNDSLMSNYEYDISITSDTNLQNVTMYLPVPVFENESKVGLEMVNGDYSDKPSDWNLSLEDTEYGLMFKIETAKIQPSYYPLPQPVSESEGLTNETLQEKPIVVSHNYSEETPVLMPIDFGTSVKTEKLIDTRSPIGSEPVLLPKYNLRESEKVPIVPNTKNINPKHSDYESLIYAQYETSPEAEVRISVRLKGSNEWWIYGWEFNEYHDEISSQLKGSQADWIRVKGEIVTGDGIYKE
jgi:hypothetical protein